MANQTVCDRCGCVLTLKDGVTTFPKITVTKDTFNGFDIVPMDTRYDVCTDCLWAIMTFFDKGLNRC